MKHTKRCIGLFLAAALVMQAVPAAQAEAAAKPKLSKKTVEIKVGAKKKVKVKKAKGYKITVKSKKKAIATVSKKGKTAFVVKGVKAGKTKVVCTAKKNKKKVTLKCTVKVTDNVADVTQAPTNTAAVTNVPTATSTPVPTLAPFPETDSLTDLPVGYADAKSYITKGKVEELTYTSKSLSKDRKALVQLPANYSADKKYPVLYLFHGENDTESAWKNMSADQIIDNAIALKYAKEMIVVMPSIKGDSDEDVIKDFAGDLKPAVEAKYSVAEGRHNNAAAGYGTGGRIALCIGLSLQDDVAYTGALAPTSGADAYIDNEKFSIKDEYKTTSFVMVLKGNSDTVAGNAPADYQKTLSDNGTDCLYLTMDGTHGNDLFKGGVYNLVRRLFKQEGDSTFSGYVTKVPTDVDNTNATQRGTLEVLEYDTETYDPGNSVTIRKKANVYLPYNYDPNKKYNVLYLMHGGGENADTWIKGDNIYGDYTRNQNMVNLMIEKGLCEPCIIVNPTFYRPDGAPAPADVWDLTTLFKYELRNDLIPAVEAKYSTYAEGNVSEENLQATRMHRAFAGLSMGSNTTYLSAFFGNYDVIAWFGPFSGYRSLTGESAQEVADKVNKIIEEGEANGMPLGYLYCGNGTADMALGAQGGQLEIMDRAVMDADNLTPGVNYDFVLIQDGEHNMWQWHIHLYNILRMFFTKE